MESKAGSMLRNISSIASTRRRLGHISAAPGRTVTTGVEGGTAKVRFYRAFMTAGRCEMAGGSAWRAEGGTRKARRRTPGQYWLHRVRQDELGLGVPQLGPTDHTIQAAEDIIPRSRCSSPRRPRHRTTFAAERVSHQHWNCGTVGW